MKAQADKNMNKLIKMTVKLLRTNNDDDVQSESSNDIQSESSNDIQSESSNDIQSESSIDVQSRSSDEIVCYSGNCYKKEFIKKYKFDSSIEKFCISYDESPENYAELVDEYLNNNYLLNYNNTKKFYETNGLFNIDKFNCDIFYYKKGEVIIDFLNDEYYLNRVKHLEDIIKSRYDPVENYADPNFFACYKEKQLELRKLKKYTKIRTSFFSVEFYKILSNNKYATNIIASKTYKIYDCIVNFYFIEENEFIASFCLPTSKQKLYVDNNNNIHKFRIIKMYQPKKQYLVIETDKNIDFYLFFKSCEKSELIKYVQKVAFRKRCLPPQSFIY